MEEKRTNAGSAPSDFNPELSNLFWNLLLIVAAFLLSARLDYLGF